MFTLLFHIMCVFSPMSATSVSVGAVLVLTYLWKHCMVLVFICLENHILVGGKSGSFMLKILNALVLLLVVVVTLFSVTSLVDSLRPIRLIQDMQPGDKLNYFSLLN